jgi:hypothetical protein
LLQPAADFRFQRHGGSLLICGLQTAAAQARPSLFLTPWNPTLRWFYVYLYAKSTIPNAQHDSGDIF